MALGQLIGGAIGTAIAPGVGTAVGSAAGSYLEGVIKERGAKKMLPSSEDPMERQFLGELDMRRKSYETGSAYQSQLRELRNIQAGTQAGIMRATAGQIGAAVKGLSET